MDLGASQSLNSSKAINSRDQVVWDDILWQQGTKVRLGLYANDINELGQVVGSMRLKKASHAALWQKGKLTDLGTLGGIDSEAVAINGRGQVVDWSETKNGQRYTVLWTKR